MTNFRKERPHVVDANISAAEAYRLMIKTYMDAPVLSNKGSHATNLFR